MIRIKAIWYCLKFGILPYWMYEKKKHYECNYFEHLMINIKMACRWALFKEDETDIEFERKVNKNYL